MAIRVSWGIWNPHFGGRGGLRGWTMAPFKRAMVVSYRLSIVTVALSVTIRPQFAIECLRRSNQQGVGQFGPKFPSVPLGVDPWCLGLQRANIPGWLMVKLFRKNSNLCDHNPPMLQTDRQTTCDHNTMLCTKVHRTVKITNYGLTRCVTRCCSCTHMTSMWVNGLLNFVVKFTVIISLCFLCCIMNVCMRGGIFVLEWRLVQ